MRLTTNPVKKVGLPRIPTLARVPRTDHTNKASARDSMVVDRRCLNYEPSQLAPSLNQPEPAEHLTCGFLAEEIDWVGGRPIVADGR